VSKITGKILLAFFLFFLVAHAGVADAVSRAESAKQFAEDVQRSLPFATLTPLAWSDSYIGQLVSRRPHFGAGISYGMIVADFSAAREEEIAQMGKPILIIAKDMDGEALSTLILNSLRGYRSRTEREEAPR
jgi:hypothetical protein